MVTARGVRVMVTARTQQSRLEIRKVVNRKCIHTKDSIVTGVVQSLCVTLNSTRDLTMQ